MRRMLFVLAFVFGIGVPIAALSPVQAQDEVTGPVVFEVHKAACPINYVDLFGPGIYEACHETRVADVTFTIAGSETEPTEFVTDADGVGTVMILDGLTQDIEVTLAENLESLSDIGAYAYCKDQLGGIVLWDATVPVDGVIALGTVTAEMQIICDWYNYTPAQDAVPDPVEALDEIPKG